MYEIVINNLSKYPPIETLVLWIWGVFYFMKKCCACKIEKELTEFAKDKYNNDGLTYKCKSCRNEYSKAYRKNNPVSYKRTYKKATNKRYLIHKEKIKAETKKYYQANREKCLAYHKEYSLKNPDKVKAKKERYAKTVNSNRRKKYKENPELFKQKAQEYRLRNPDKVKETRKKAALNNKEKKREWQQNRYKFRMDTDSLFYLKNKLRCRIIAAIKRGGYTKKSSCANILGAKYEIIKENIGRQFTKGMNWNNHGDWHIDHIIPLASAKTEKELISLFHYTNLQPLWATDNILKGAKILPTQMTMTI